jgi:transcriptional regulator with XRE-family HTH domain
MLPHEKKFVESLTRALSDSGLNKSELARKAGISHPQLFRYFKGVVPRYPVAVRLAEALGISPIALLHRDSEELQPSSDITPDEIHLLREVPTMPYTSPHPTHPQPTFAEMQAKMTADEIYSRLLQSFGATRNIRVHLRAQINTRLDEFESLCASQCRDSTP